MKKLSDRLALLLEKYEPFHQSLILFSLAGVGVIFLVIIILMIL